MLLEQTAKNIWDELKWANFCLHFLDLSSKKRQN